MQQQAVTFADIRKKFDFRSIAIGRWVTKQEQARAAQKFDGALAVLMHILRCPPEVISLRSNLAFQFGIGGRPGVAAHYDPAQRCFSLAKNAGPGSVAHEWFHAFDHYLGNKAFSDVGNSMFSSQAWIKDATPVVHPLNDLWFRCLSAILLSQDGVQSSELFQNSATVDRRLQTHYFSQPEELCARAFEAFIDDNSQNERFLVSNTLNSEEAKANLYPRGAQREAINTAFSAYFSALGAALSASLKGNTPQNLN